MFRFRPLSLILIALGLLLITAPLPVWAHSFSLSTSFSETGSGVSQSSNHAEAEPFKGWMYLTVTNTGTEAWGDFHFQIYEVPTYGSVENVDFIVDSPNQPTSSQSGLTWSVDNSVTGATLDLYFYDDPVLPSETATFSIYTDNTADELAFFGALFYPTPVPVPSSMLLLGSAIIGLVGIRRFKK